MEKSVNGIRETFYRDLIRDYKQDDTRTTSFLYRYFRKESVAGLLEKYFSRVPVERPLRHRPKKQLAEAVKECPEWDRSLLLRAVPGKEHKERRDFWEELWLNDIGYKAGLISDSEYYLWLVEYLAVRDIYYKDNSMPEGHSWLYQLLLNGLQDTENALAREQLRKDRKNIRTKAQVGRDLAQLAKLIQKDRDTVAGRLHGLKIYRKEERREQDYLPWLTARLEQMALHIKIKTWLQDSGYPLREEKSPEKTPKETSKESRKQDFSMRLFETYCDSEEGYDFSKKNMGGSMAAGSWRVDGNGFCIMDETQIAPLLDALKKSETDRLYLPLAVDLFSGCIFFLAGKGNYEDVYNKEDKEYEDAKAEADFCFDYLRLNPEWGNLEGKEYFSETPAKIFRLEPAFHENVGRSYQAVLNDFGRYCVTGDNSPREMIKAFNEVKAGSIPDDVAIPDAFKWGF